MRALDYVDAELGDLANDAAAVLLVNRLLSGVVRHCLELDQDAVWRGQPRLASGRVTA